MSFLPLFSTETWTLLALFFTLLMTIFESRRPIMMISDPTMIKTIMVKECYTVFTNRRDFDFGGPLSDAVSLVKDEKWRRIRSAISPFFTSGRLKDVYPIVLKYADALCQNLKKRDLKEPIIMKDLLGPHSMDVVTSSSFSIEVDSVNNPDDPFVTHMKKMFKIGPTFVLVFIFPFLGPILDKLGFGMFSKESVDFFYRAIRKVKDQHHEDHSNQVDFLRLMIQSQISEEQADKYTDDRPVKGLTDHEILSQSLIFIFAGYETTSSTLCLLLYNLATNQDTMKKLQEEINEFFPKETPVTYEALMRMEYLEMVLNESQRIWPTAPRIERVCKMTVEVNGVTIPKDMLVGVPTFAMHRDPRLWDSPESFIPERFSKDNKKSIDPYTYLPFGVGPRNCIGMRFAVLIVKLTVVKLLQDFDLETCKETPIPLEMSILYQPKKPITLKLVRRAPTNSEI